MIYTEENSNKTPKEVLTDKIKREMLNHYLVVNSEGTLINAPGSSVKHLPEGDPERIRVENDELHEFISLAFDVRIPRKAVEDGHSAPFDFVSDLYFERVKNALGFANRSGGKTLSVAILNFLDMMFKKRCEIASAGAVLDQANKCYRYFRSFLHKHWFKEFCEKYHRMTGVNFLKSSVQSWTSFANGSNQEVVTGTEKGLRSPHPNKARIDEIDLMDWSLLQTALSMACGTPRIRGQNVFTSTRQKAGGSMQRILDEAETKGIKVYEWNIWEVVQRCTRRCIDDPKHGTCPIFDYCQGKAHRCDGYYQIDDFIDKVKLIDREIWETEWLNKKPSRDKLVYYMFEAQRHVMTPSMLNTMFGVGYPSAYWPRVSGLDFGSGPEHPFVYLKCCQLPNGAYLVFYEYYAEQRLLRDHAQVIKSSPFYSPGEPIYADWAAQERLELKKEYHVSTRQAVKDVLVGINYIKTLLSGFPPNFVPQLYVWYELNQLIHELGKFQWPVLVGGRVDRTGLPLKRWDHGPDALRYSLFSSKYGIERSYSARTIPGL